MAFIRKIRWTFEPAAFESSRRATDAHPENPSAPLAAAVGARAAIDCRRFGEV